MRVARFTALPILAAMVTLAGGACTRLGDQQMLSGTYGLELFKVRGDRQVIYSNQITRTNLTVQVVATTEYAPVSGVKVNFSEVTSSGVGILTPSVESDSNGYASTPIRMPTTMGSSVQILAEIEGTSASALFTLQVSDSQPGVRYVLETVDGSPTRTAGVPFRFVIRIVDDEGKTDQAVNETQLLQWTFNTASSWGGTAPTIPTTTICSFIGGMCLTEEYILTDARSPTYVWVGDGPSGYFDVFGKEITVVSGVPAKATFSNKQGGPAAGASVVTSSAQISLTADDIAQTYYAAITDSVGNFIQDADATADWTVSNETLLTSSTPASVITPYLVDGGSHVVFTPTLTGKGKLSVSYSGFSVSKDLIIEPGAPSSVVVNTEHGNVEAPGIPFLIDISVTDAKGNAVVRSDNLSPINGNYTVYYSLGATTVDGDATGSVVDTPPAVSGGCSGIIVTAGLITKVWCPGTSGPMIFFNGVPTSSMRLAGQIFDATGVSPVLSVRIPYPTSSSTTYLKGQVAVNVSVGTPHHLNLYRTAGDPSSHVCLLPGSSGQNCRYSPVDNCLTGACMPNVADDIRMQMKAGQAPESFYLGVEDAGGNFLSHTEATSYYTMGNWGSDWSASVQNVSGQNVSKFTINPTKTGGSSLTITAPQASSTFNGSTWSGDIDSIVLSVDDGQSINSISALRTHTLKIAAYDSFGNFISNDGRYCRTPVPFSISYTGATASPKGTAPVVPASGNYDLDMGYYAQCIAKLSNDGVGYRLPNASNLVSINVTHLSTGISASLVPTIVPGSPISMTLRDAPNNGGNSVSGGTFNMTTDSSKILYLAALDTEFNLITNAGAANWNMGTLSSIATLTAGSNSYDINPTLTGSSNVSVSFQGLNTSTNVVVNPGVLNKIALQTTNALSETAGVPFQLSAVFMDAKNNTKTDIDGSITLNISLQNAATTLYGYNTVGTTGTVALNFTDGVLDPPLNYTLYDTQNSPRFVMTYSGVSGQANLVLASGGFDHVRIKRSGAGNYIAGDPLTLNVGASDLYGNTITSGPGVGSLSFGITSFVGGQDITSTTLSGASSVAGASDTSVTGNLVTGSANIVLQATQTGNLTFSGSIAGFPGNAPPANAVDQVTVYPRPTINSIAYDPTPTNPHTASSTYSMDPIGVKLLDVYGNTITTDSATQVTLTTPSSVGSLSGTTTKPVTSGIALFTSLKYAKAESLTLRATESTSAKSVDFALTVQPGPAVQAIVVLPGQTLNEGVTSPALAITNSGSTDQTSCSDFTVNVYAVDDGFNRATGYNGAVGLTSSDTKATLPGASNFVGGLKSFTLTNRVAGSQTITPTSGLGLNIPSSAYTVNTGSPSNIILLLPGQALDPGAANATAAITGAAADQAAGTLFNVSAKLTDSCFNVVNNSVATVGLSAFGATAGFTGFTAGSFPGSGNVLWTGTQTFAAGSASFDLTYYNTNITTGTTPRLTPTSAYTNNVSSSFNVLNAAGDHLEFLAHPSGANVAGASLGAQAVIHDVYHNKVTSGADASVNVTLTRAGGNGLISNGSGANTAASLVKAAASGLADFNSGNPIATVQDVSTGNTLTASATLAAGARNITGGSTFSITPASLSTFLVTGITSPSNAGDAQAMSVTAKDAYGNTKTDFTGAVSFTSSDVQAVLPGAYTFIAGDLGTKSFASGSVVLKTAGATHWVKATFGAQNGQQSSIQINALAPTKLAFSGATSVNAGSCSNAITVTSKDPYDNVSAVSGNTTVTLSGAPGPSSDANADLYATGCGATLSGAGPNARTLMISSGSSSSTLAFRGEKKQTVTLNSANDGGLSNGAWALSVGFNSSNLTMTKISGDAQTGTVGAALASPIKVQITDNYSNTANGVTVSFGTGSGSVSASNVVTDTDGYAQTNWTLGTTAGAQTRTASYSGLSQVFSATANPGSATQLAFSTQPVATQTKGNAFATQPKVEVRDSYGNKVTGATNTVTLTPATSSACTIDASGSIANNSIPAVAGLATFAGVSHTYPEAGSRALYIKASATGLSPACSSVTTVYDTLTITPANPTLATGTAQTFTASGGVPPLTIDLSQNQSQSATGSCSNCTTLNYTSGQKGGNSQDIVRVRDSAAAQNSALSTVTVTGALLGWDRSTDSFASAGSDVAHAGVTLTNSGSAASGTVNISLSNCTDNGGAVACATHWDSGAGINCQGASLASGGGSCSINLTFKGTAATAGHTYTAEVHAIGSAGGDVKIDLTGTR